ncbi:hypothetical protein RvY_12705 [Ramazzottius varieornatus]|uniref:Uridine 5'-monophosphate synthase n=1 Tax=Ramazzottius varieornatus TaxID=947166 RepID=A0A1D1VKF6_RAMVA|nr:hypothetical protein RvY_12705 [Ramazzottius varieornatus]
MDTSSPATIQSLDEIILEFYAAGVIKLGQYKLKSGVMSPIYIDLRELIGFPKLLNTAAQLLHNVIRQKSSSISCDVLCGAPYAAVPVCTLVTVAQNIPMVMRRKEVKEYGTKKAVEGPVKDGAKCVIIDDVCTSGLSIMETATDLRKVGLVVEHAVILLDREAGGPFNLQNEGITLHSVMTLSYVCQTLVKSGKLDPKMAKQIEQFMASQAPDPKPQKVVNGNGLSKTWKQQSFSARAEHTSNAVAKHLFQLMDRKKSNLIVAADLTSTEAILNLADAIGPNICAFKIHADIIDGFSEDFVSKLKELSQTHRFLIFEDRKFSDIGSTVARQYGGGVFQIAHWADMVTIQPTPGPAVIEGLKKGQRSGHGIGGALIAEMSSKGALPNKENVAATIQMAHDHPEDIMGYICQSDIDDEPRFVRMTPGVHISEAGDTLGQQYVLPETVIENCADAVIVGRGITEAFKPSEAARMYQTRAFEAYLKRTSQ